jgi:hypothetical protein
MVITIFSNQDIRLICWPRWAAKAYQYIGQLIKLQPDVTRSNVLVLEC